MNNQTQSLYQSRFFCISKGERTDNVKKVYQKRLSEIFQNERKPIDFIITTYQYIDPQYKTVKSSIKFYKKIFQSSIDKDNKVLEEKNNEELKKTFCASNKNENFKNISFLDQLGTFYDKTLYFIRYISNTRVTNTMYDTQIIEIARCGFNMGEILKNMGYVQAKENTLMGFYYQYKYFPIICYYTSVFNEEKDTKKKKNYIFLQVIGYYTEKTKKEIIQELDNIKTLLSELFYIKNKKNN